MAIDWRERIRPSIILRKLQDHVESEEGDLLTMSQIKAAEILLRKVIPDLKAIEHTGLELPPRLIIDMRPAPIEGQVTARHISGPRAALEAPVDAVASVVPAPHPQVPLEAARRPRGRPRKYPEGYKAARTARKAP